MTAAHFLLRLQSIRVCYDHLEALKGVSLHLEAGEIVALVGANGAGKTTTLAAICGLLPLRGGEIQFQGRSLAGLRPDQIVQLGITQVPEGRMIFAEMPVVDNLRLGAYLRLRAGQRRAVAEDLERMLDLFPILRERKHVLAGNLSGGEQQMLALGRALMARPRLLILDEPTIGLAPRLASQILHTVAELREQGTTILLVEQNVLASLQIADRGYVLETGRVVLQGLSEELLRNRDVQRAYLGKDYEEV
ncbi:MAG: ABC transporter ATP-binding protein [candidate division WS1 bacterium]|jgi:branched-chain amino acid transport system ATP-binding protein|nr:ABC transporter ATP-binding protein [candidate division WS1 bacterium]